MTEQVTSKQARLNDSPMRGGELRGPGDVEATYDTPPSTATSSTETVTTNDEDARRCEEWELFSNFDGQSRPSESRLDSHRSEYSEASWISANGSARTQTLENDRESSEKSNAGDEEEDTSEVESSAEGEEAEDSSAIGDWEPEVTETSEIEATEANVKLASPDPCALSSKPVNDEDACPTQRVVQESSRSTASFTPANADADRSLNTTSSRIQVFVRVRPPGRGEIDGVAVKLGVSPNSLRVQSTNLSSVTECTVDRVFIDGATQQDVYTSVERGVQASLDGMNATIFAYGQTGTGKTYTMFGDDCETVGDGEETGVTSKSTVPSNWGVIPRALCELITRTKTLQEEGRAKLSCSFLQIYNDRVFDLLTDRKRQKPLIIREQPVDGGTNVVLQGLSNEPISSLTDALQLVRRGRMNRSVRETELNASSSRSHAIVQVHVAIEDQLSNGDKRTRSSRLNLVDLAGSEKWNTDLDMEDRHTVELKNINTSLSALGNCIAALAEAGRRHIPYRDSTLTRLLQDSFGGNTLSFLIATVSPSQKATEETIRTLQFADRARSVMQTVKVNESFSGNSELLAAKAQIKQLRDRLSQEQRRRHETRLKEYEVMQNDFAMKLQAKDEEIQRLARDNEVFAKWRAEDVARIRVLETRLREVEDERKKHSCREEHERGDVRAYQPRQDIGVTVVLSEERVNEDNQVTSDPRTTHDRVSGHKRTSLIRKPSMKTSTNKHKPPENMPLATPATNDKPEKPRIKSYRSLLEKYALPPQKGRQGEIVREARRAPGNNDSAVHPITVKASESPHELHRIQDPAMSTSPTKLTPLGRSMSDTSFTVICSPKNVSRQGEDVEAPRHLVPSHDQSPALHKAESLPALSGSQQPHHHHQQQLWSAFGQPVPTRTEVSRLSYHYGTGEDNAKQAWQLPPVVPESQAMPRSEPLVAATGPPPNTCVKHSLKGCVLCAVKDNTWPPAASQNANPPSSKVTTANVETAFSTEPEPTCQSGKAADDGRPCERHQLPGCFICTKSNSSSAWQSSGVSYTSSNAAPPAGSVSAASASSFMPAYQDSKCSTHRLANCVICAGLNNYRAPPAASYPVETPSPTTWSPSESSWRSNSMATSTPAVLTKITNSTMASNTRISTWEASSTPEATPNRTQYLAPAAYQQTQISAGSTSYGVPQGDPEDPGLLMSPTRASTITSSSSFPSPAMRPNLKEKPSDMAARRQFNALVREASDAANMVLRRRV